MRAAAAHVAGAHRGRRYATARHLADLFAGYAVHRPDLLTAWRDGTGVPGERAADLAWQPELWRRLRARIGAPGPAERLAAACAVLRQRPEVAALPTRISLFGPTRLPAEHLAVLSALAEHHDVHLWLAHPSPACGRLAPRRPPSRSGAPTPPRPHPATRYWPRSAATSASCGSPPRRPAAPTPTTRCPSTPGPARCWGGCNETSATIGTRRRKDLPTATGDRSVQVHSCHGPARQVEVMREVVLGLLEDDPSLELRDVISCAPTSRRSPR